MNSAYSTAIVETSVAVATPPVDRASNEKRQDQSRRSEEQRASDQGAWRPAHALQILVTAVPARQNGWEREEQHHRHRDPSAVKNPAMETPAAAPSTIRTMLGGTVSAMAAPVARSAIISRGGGCPRRFISGNSAGATVAMSETLEPEMPDTMNNEPSSTYDMPARMWPSKRGEEVDNSLAHSRGIGGMQPNRTKIGTRKMRMMPDIPSSILPIIYKASAPGVAKAR